jgi:hypothetical protein
VGHIKAACPKQVVVAATEVVVAATGAPAAPAVSTRKCYRCGQTTSDWRHTAATCTATPAPPRKCYNCNGMGHIAKECKAQKVKTRATGAVESAAHAAGGGGGTTLVFNLPPQVPGAAPVDLVQLLAQYAQRGTVAVGGNVVALRSAAKRAAPPLARMVDPYAERAAAAELTQLADPAAGWGSPDGPWKPSEVLEIGVGGAPQLYMVGLAPGKRGPRKYTVYFDSGGAGATAAGAFVCADSVEGLPLRACEPITVTGVGGSAWATASKMVTIDIKIDHSGARTQDEINTGRPAGITSTGGTVDALVFSRVEWDKSVYPADLVINPGALKTQPWLGPLWALVLSAQGNGGFRSHAAVTASLRTEVRGTDMGWAPTTVMLPVGDGRDASAMPFGSLFTVEPAKVAVLENSNKLPYAMRPGIPASMAELQERVNWEHLDGKLPHRSEEPTSELQSRV